jgi:ABC-type multidrug transport system permease subunit
VEIPTDSEDDHWSADKGAVIASATARNPGYTELGFEQALTQAITMPLFFSSTALYPISVMPGWLQPISRVNPLSYEVDGLRSLLIGTGGHLPLDFAVLLGATVLSVSAASALLPRLAK